MYQVVRLVQLVAEADLPEAVAYLLITALHKEDKEKQLVTTAVGLDAPLREIHRAALS